MAAEEAAVEVEEDEVCKHQILLFTADFVIGRSPLLNVKHDFQLSAISRAYISNYYVNLGSVDCDYI